jgi:hypothetical protein
MTGQVVATLQDRHGTITKMGTTMTLTLTTMRMGVTNNGCHDEDDDRDKEEKDIEDGGDDRDGDMNHRRMRGQYKPQDRDTSDNGTGI